MHLEFKANFSRQFPDTSCPLKFKNKHTNSQENILICEALKTEKNSVEYSNFFNDIHKQLKAARLYIKLIKERKQILEENPNSKNCNPSMDLCTRLCMLF